MPKSERAFELKSDLGTSGNCVHVRHDGSTDQIALNEPADGDIAFVPGFCSGGNLTCNADGTWK